MRRETPWRLGFVLLAMLPVPVPSVAQVTVDYDLVRKTNPLPDDAAVQEALERLKPERDRALNATPARPVDMPEAATAKEVPDVRAKPIRIDALPGKLGKLPVTTSRPFLDVGQIAKAYETVARVPVAGQEFDFRLFVSFSIPPNDLRAMVENATDAGATVVFRGPADKDDLSMARFANKLKALGVTRAGVMEMDPPAFSKFRIKRVPAYVLSERTASAKEVDGCAPPGAYAVVAGTMSPEYALNIFKAGSKEDMADAAERRLSALKSKRVSTGFR